MVFKDTIQFLQNTHQTTSGIPLHAPVFNGKEREYVMDTLNLLLFLPLEHMSTARKK